MDLYNEIAELQKVYSKKNHHRLEVSISSDMDEWTCEFGMEAWAARLSVGIGKTPIEAFQLARGRLEI